MSFCVFELDLAISVALEIATEKNFKYFLIKSNNNRSNTLLKKNNYFFFKKKKQNKLRKQPCFTFLQISFMSGLVEFSWVSASAFKPLLHLNHCTIVLVEVHEES